MNFFYTSEVSDSDSSSCNDTSSGSESPFLPSYIRKPKNDYKIINSEKRFKKFNKYKSSILIFHRLDQDHLDDFVQNVKMCSSSFSNNCGGRGSNSNYKVGVIDANDQWCQGVVPASCKDHPYVQWYRQGKRVSTPVEVKFQYAKLIGGVLGFNKRVDAAPVVVGSGDAQRNGSEMIGMMEQACFVSPAPFFEHYKARM